MFFLSKFEIPVSILSLQKEDIRRSSASFLLQGEKTLST